MSHDQKHINNIPMLNLVRQEEAIRERLHEAVFGAMKDGIYISQESITPFEAKLARYCGRPYAVGVGSGTAALHIALIASGIGSGHEVVTVPNSFFATTEVILQVGAEPIFVDIDPQTHLMNLQSLTEAITERTRAIIPVHLYGNVVDIKAVHHLLDHLGRQDVVVIEDCAHAMGAKISDQSVPIGRIGAFSFNPVKNLGALSDAGAIVTSDLEISTKAVLLRDHGRVDKNKHALVGFNSRLSRINDRVLSVKIDYLDEWNDRRGDIARCYNLALSELSDITSVVIPKEVRSSYHQYVICSPRRDQLHKHLMQRGISTWIHYPRLIPEHKPLSELGYGLSQIPVAVRLNRQILSLPCYPELTDTEVDRIINGVGEFTKLCLETPICNGG